MKTSGVAVSGVLDGLTTPVVYVQHGENAAIFSPDERYRYLLTRKWDATGKMLPVIGLNPSTATHEIDDPTIRRCIGFAKAWGYGGLVMLNLFAFRATDPKTMIAHLDAGGDIVGPANDAVLAQYATPEREILCAWGVHGDIEARGFAVTQALGAVAALQCLGKTKGGCPKHPLYLAASTARESFP